MVWLPVSGIFNVHTDVDAGNSCGGCMNTIESALKVTLGKKSCISIIGAFQSDTLPTALSQPFVHEIYIRNEASHYVFVNLSQKFF